MDLIVKTNGKLTCIYSEAMELNVLGKIVIQRASHVEPTCDGRWTADLSPVLGPILGPFDYRSQALNAEVKWLQTHLPQIQSEVCRVVPQK